MRDCRYLQLAWITIIFVTAYRFLVAARGLYPLATEEAHYWEWSRNLDLNYYSKPPMVAYLIHLATVLAGHTAFAIRGLAVALSFLTAVITYFFVQRLFQSPRVTFFTVLVMNLVPLFVVGALILTTDTPLMFFWAATCYLLYVAMMENRARFWYAAGITFGLGMLSKYAMIYLLPCLAVFFLIAPEQRHWLRRKELWLMLLIGGILFLPVIYWNYAMDWVTFRHVAGNADLGEGWRFNIDWLADFVLGQAALVSPVLFIAMIYFSWRVLREGTAATLSLRFLVALGLPVFAMLLLKSLQGRVLANWAAPAYYTWTIFTVHQSVVFWDRHQSAHRRKLAAVAVLGFALPVLAFPLLHERKAFDFFMDVSEELAGRSLPIAMHPGYRLVGWEELGEELTGIIQNLQGTEAVFIFTDSYHIAAEAAFYTKGNPRTYAISFGKRRMNQYDIWGPPGEEYRGHDAIYIDQYRREDKRLQRLHSRITEHFDAVGERHDMRVELRGEFVRGYSLFVLHDFDGEFEGAVEDSGRY